MDAGETDGGDGSSAGRRRPAPGQVWVACTVCRRPVELTDAVVTRGGLVCPHCSAR